MELERGQAALRERGLGLAAVSYDSVAVLESFAARRGISFPLLSDPGSAIIRRFGLLNPAHPEGEFGHGVPYPGTFVTDAAGIVRERHFEDAYTDRRSVASLLVLAGADAEAERTLTRTDLFELATAASDAEVVPGRRVTLVLELALAPGLHAYAPGAAEYRALSLRLDRHELAELHAPVLPASRDFYFAPLDETVPVFEGRVRIRQDVTFADGRGFQGFFARGETSLALTGTLDYQLCSDKVCYPPASLPVRWQFRVAPLDRERAPEAIRPR